MKIYFKILLLYGILINDLNAAPPPPTYHVTYQTSDWRVLVPENASIYKNYRMIILQTNDMSPDEKAEKIAKKYTEIQNKVEKSRRETYTNVNELVSVGNSVIKGSSGGGSKTVNAKCASPSKPQMYTKTEWARGAYKSGNEDATPAILSTGIAISPSSLVGNNGLRICAITLKQSGKGRKVAYSEATFRILPKHIDEIVNNEVLSIMYEVSNTAL